MARSKTKPVTPADFSEKTFQGLDRASLDMEKDKALIVRRVLEHGGPKEWNLLRDHYTLKGIAEVATQFEKFEPMILYHTARFVRVSQKKFKSYVRLYHAYTPPPKTEEAKRITIKDFPSYPFWKKDHIKFDFEKHKYYIIENVIEYGDEKDWELLKTRYTLDGIANVAKEFRYLTPKGIDFISEKTGLPKEEFRCYRFRQLYPPSPPF